MHGMIDHIKLLVVFGNLLVGAAMAAYLHQVHRRTGLRPLKPIFYHIVFYNLLVLVLFISKYYEVNIAANAFTLPPEVKQVLQNALLYVFLMGFSYASLGIYLAFMEAKLSSRLRRAIAIASLVLIAGIPMELFLPEKSIGRLIHYHIYENVGGVFLVLEFGIMIALPIRARRIRDRERARIAQVFSYFYISRYPMIATFLLLPQPYRLLIALLYPNLAPYLWLRFFALPHAERAVLREATGADVGGVAERYALSPRETEILALILEGKSNRDMEETLFISYHTVKNHVYNIYRKLGVKTRFELLHLVSTAAGAKNGVPGE